MSQNKWIYNFTISRKIKSKKEEASKDAEGNDITITRDVLVDKDYHFKIKKPNRKIIEEADIFYAAKMGEFLKAGLLSRNLIAKRLEDDGGDLSKETLKETQEKIKEYYTLSLEIEKLKSQEKIEDAELSEKINRYQEIQNELKSLELERSEIFDYSAESKAYAKQIFWYTLYLCYWNKGEEQEDDKYEEFFAGKDFEQKAESYDKREEEFTDAEFFNKLTANLSFSVSYWLNTGGKASETDIQEAFKKAGF